MQSQDKTYDHQKEAIRIEATRKTNGFIGLTSFNPLRLRPLPNSYYSNVSAYILRSLGHCVFCVFSPKTGSWILNITLEMTLSLLTDPVEPGLFYKHLGD